MAITTLSDVKDYLDITDATYDKKINLLIPAVEQQYLDIRNVPFDIEEVDDEDVTVYPTGSDITAAEMIGFKLTNTAGGLASNYGREVASEGLDAHSISFTSGSGIATRSGYPKAIISSIKVFIDGR